MHFRGGLLYLTNNDSLFLHGQFGFEEISNLNRRLHLNEDVVQYLANCQGPTWQNELQAEFSIDEIDNSIKELLYLSDLNLWVPLVAGPELRGLIILRLGFRKEWMSQEDIDILRTIAALIAIASENVSLLEELRVQLLRLEEARADLVESRKSLAEGREFERLHIARELHDGPIQDLYAFRLKFGNLTPVEVGKSIEEMNREILTVIHELRDLCMHLRPPVLAYFGFEPAVRSLVNKFSVDYPGINVRMNVQLDGPVLADSQKTALYRILQEALNNIGQHAGAGEVWIQYAIDDGVVTLEVVDDGLGFSVPARWVEFARKGHLGLLGIAERAESFGGFLNIISGPGRGTALQVSAPYLGEQERDAEQFAEKALEVD
jgi:signal transduction histidine kinase